jgi:parvulin-like peptidyl-prolyl isomerase
LTAILKSRAVRNSGKEDHLRKSAPFALLFLAILVLAACGGGSTSENTATATDVISQVATTDPRTTLAAEVNGEPITLEALDRQIAFFEAGGTAAAADRAALTGTILERLIEQELVEQAAASMDITVTEEQVQAEIAALQADAANQGISLDEYFALQGISAEDYPERLREALLTAAVNQQVTANVPTTTAEVHARHIVVADEATARDILNQLNGGADFAQLAEQYSLDRSTSEAGGDLGWITPGLLLQPEVEAAIFSLPVNSRAPEPVQSALGYHIIESIERGEDVPLTPTGLAQRRQQAWLDWLDQQRAAATIVRYAGPNAQQ